LGGGCEILMHSHHVQAHAETYAGLVEVGVGLLPAWGGSTELLTRALQSKKLPKGPMPPAAHAFETISTAKVGLSAFEAKDLMYFRDTDGVTMNKSRLLADAKAKAIEMAKDFKPEQPFDLALPGPSGLAAFRMAVDGAYLKGAATTYDVVVSDRVARVLTGGEQAGPGALITQDRLRELEFEHFMALVHDPRTVARIESMIKAGKPLREAPDAKETAITLRDSAEQKPSFLSRIPILRNIFGAHCKKDAANDNGVVRDTKAKMNWPNIKK
jgi:3-hydroxyacyl-CoA dehydrogenase